MKIIRDREDKKMRPSNWNERVASLYAAFDASKRLKYRTDVRPGFHEGRRCVCVTLDSDKCADILRFAEENDLEILDRKND